MSDDDENQQALELYRRNEAHTNTGTIAYTLSHVTATLRLINVDFLDLPDLSKYTHITKLFLGADYRAKNNINPAKLPPNIKDVLLELESARELPDLSRFIQVTSLELKYYGEWGKCDKVIVNPAYLPPRLKKLDLYSLELTELPDLHHLTDLIKLNLSFNPGIKINPAHLPPNLEQLELLDYKLPDLSKCIHITKLIFVYHCECIINSAHLPPNLEELEFNWGFVWRHKKLLDLPDLLRFARLTKLIMTGDIVYFIATHLPPNLEELILEDCNLRELPDLSHLIHLAQIQICGNKYIILPPTHWPPNLIKLILLECGLSKLIIECPKLIELYVGLNPIETLIVTSPNIKKIGMLEVKAKKIEYFNIPLGIELKICDTKPELEFRQIYNNIGLVNAALLKQTWYKDHQFPEDIVKEIMKFVNPRPFWPILHNI